MSRDGSGTYSLPEAAFVDGTTIEVDPMNNNFSDVASALTASLAKDGQTVPTAHLPMGGFKLTGLAAGSGAGDSVRYEQLGQIVSTQTTAVATGTTQIPTDDTTPQNTEGDEYMTRAITPKSASSTLVIDVTIVLASSQTSRTMTVALFQDSTADALKAVPEGINAADNPVTVRLQHVMTSGTTSATTFKVRAGINGAGTVTLNGASATRLYGGVAGSSIVIREVFP